MITVFEIVQALLASTLITLAAHSIMMSATRLAGGDMDQ